jgi:2,3-bisphosphoglycerate-dependent phosphoglycerate mutase
MATLYLIRHAHSTWQRSEKRPLSPQGLVQAQRVARILTNVRPAAIYSSPARRAVQTVEPMAKRLNLQPKLEADLRERVLSSEPMVDFEGAVLATWSNFSFAFPGGETNEAAKARAVAVLRRIALAHADGPAIVGTHGNLLALALASVDSSIGFEFWRALTFPDIFRLDLREPLSRSSFERVWSEAA